MARRLLIASALIALTACTPVVVGVAVIGADAIAEDRMGGDGLF